jgi:hypothetical protein
MRIPSLICTGLWLALGVSLTVRGEDAGAAPQHSLGIWKAAVPRTPMKGEFENNDPLGVEAGARIWADCSLNWVDPDDGRRYCFVSGTSLEYFLDRPQFHMQQARVGWRKLTSP